MKKIFSSAVLASLFMVASSHALASQDYTVHFENTSAKAKYVKQLNSQCMHSPKDGSTNTVPPRGGIDLPMTDSNNVSGACTNGSKEINWAVDDENPTIANLTFKHYKLNGTWYTKVSTSSGLSATITCNNRDCSTSGSPGVSGEPSPIIITFN
ncbi:hypothetical protein [Pantoea sp. Cy-639]|uniref:hypothetical protein n=1 Tax=Pantoea sp. Cy-639 TaxID=2608360 RepID=UPI0014246FD0|nr:hypothetical protein [Pantoea sp. Cy-639]NIF19664.1 hypothetical protein [Pantoea sp. Cy-639]